MLFKAKSKPIVNLNDPSMRRLLFCSPGGISLATAQRMRKPMAERISKKVARQVFDAAISNDKAKVEFFLAPIINEVFPGIGYEEHMWVREFALSQAVLYTMSTANLAAQNRGVKSRSHSLKIWQKIWKISSVVAVSAAAG
jgi:hypothetical protein